MFVKNSKQYQHDDDENDETLDKVFNTKCTTLTHGIAISIVIRYLILLFFKFNLIFVNLKLCFKMYFLNFLGIVILYHKIVLLI